mmetsp:Transcript_41838/g.100424  ORF Transcript_41838/g.100424 Transcript_41838/m.100424 type:complete len:225 (+) Transcript_41838:2712-3386(+)
MTGSSQLRSQWQIGNIFWQGIPRSFVVHKLLSGRIPQWLPLLANGFVVFSGRERRPECLYHFVSFVELGMQGNWAKSIDAVTKIAITIIRKDLVSCLNGNLSHILHTMIHRECTGPGANITCVFGIDARRIDRISHYTPCIHQCRETIRRHADAGYQTFDAGSLKAAACHVAAPGVGVCQTTIIASTGLLVAAAVEFEEDLVYYLWWSNHCPDLMSRSRKETQS